MGSPIGRPSPSAASRAAPPPVGSPPWAPLGPHGFTKPHSVPTEPRTVLSSEPRAERSKLAQLSAGTPRREERTAGQPKKRRFAC